MKALVLNNKFYEKFLKINKSQNIFLKSYKIDLFSKYINYSKYLYIFYLKVVFFKKLDIFSQFFLKQMVVISSNKNFKKYLNSDIVNKLFRSFMKSGKKLKIYNIVLFSFFKIYSLLNLNMFYEITKNYLYFKEFLFNKELNKNFNNVSVILNWLFFWYQPMFFVKCVLVPKKYRKKLKKRYIYSADYLEPYKRKNVALKWMLFFLSTFNNYKAKNRLFLLFSDLIFNFKNSIVYTRKIKMYKKVFKI